MILKKFIPAALSALLITGALCSCSNGSSFSDGETLSKSYERSADTEKTYNFADGAQEPPAAYNSYTNLITGYELKLFRAVAADNGSDTSFAFSPAVNALDLSLLANGAKGDTQSEIMLALGSDLSLEQLNTCSSYFKSRLESVSELGKNKTDELSGKTVSDESTASIKFSDAFLFNNKSDVRTTFLQCNADFYGNSILRFDYEDENAQVKLDGLFEDIPSGGKITLNGDDTLLTAASVQLSDMWLSPYGQSDITEGKFSGKDAQFMTSSESCIQTETAKGIIKYTAKNPLKLVLVLPNENIGLDKYLKTFDNNEYMNLLDSFSVTSRVSAVVPQFEIAASDEPVAMSGVMKTSGLYTLFTDKSDFGNLAHTQDLMLNEMYELRAGFSLNKNGVSTSKGSQLDAALTQSAERQESSEEKLDELKFDRPFIFMLIDNESNIPVYMGVCNNV